MNKKTNPEEVLANLEEKALTHCGGGDDEDEKKEKPVPIAVAGVRG